MKDHDYSPKNAERQMAQIRATPNLIAEAVMGLNEDTLRSAPGKEWSAVQILAHLLSCDSVWFHAIYEILTLKSPTLTKIAPNDWSRTVPYEHAAFSDLMQKFIFDRKILLDVLKDLPPDRWEWQAKIGTLTHNVYGLVRRTAMHDVVHVAQIQNLFKRT